MSKDKGTTTREVAASRDWVSPQDPPLEEILYGTLTKLQKLRLQEPRAAQYIEKWCEHRQKTIDLIPKLRETVETICSRCNTGRQGGTAAAIGGLVSVVIGAILKVKGIPAGDQFLDGGKYLTATGTAVLAVSNLAEAGLTISPTNKIKEVIEKDIELTEPIRRWIVFSHEVEYCFDKLLECNIASSGFLKVMKVLLDCISLLNAGTYEITDLIQDIRLCKVKGIRNVTVDVSRNVIRFLERIRNNPKITKPLKEICKIACETPTLIQFVNLGINVYFQTYGIMPNLPFDFKSSNVFHCALDVIKMLFDLVTNVRFKEIEERQTAYFKALKEVTCALKIELKQVENSLKEREAGYENLLEELNDLKLGP